MRKSLVSKQIRNSHSTILARAAGLALAVAVAGPWLAGCDRDDPVAAAIQRATVDLGVISPGSAMSATPALDAQSYTKIIAALKSVSGKGGDGQQASVDLLTARAQLGLATQTAADAAELERVALLNIAGVRAALQEYFSYSAQATALSQFDPAPLLADLDKQITAREADLTKARKSKQDIDAQIAALRAQSQAKLDMAAAEHKIEAELRQQAIRVSNTEAADLIVQANEHRRIADAFDVEASLLDAQAAQIAPRSPEAQLLIDQITNQRDQLGKGREEVENRARVTREQASKAKAAQAQAADAVDAAYKALIASREGDLPKKYDEAAKQFGDAAASAKRAEKANKSQAALAIGDARQSLGDLNWARARGIASAQATSNLLATANPALPQKAEYAKQAADQAAAQKAALDAATEAYEAAKSAYEGSGVKGDAAARIEEVGRSLSNIILKTSDGSVDLRSDADKSGAAPDKPAPAPSAPVAAADSPQGTVDAVIAAAGAGRYEEIGNYLYIPDASMRELTLSSLKMLTKFQRLDDACKAKLGKALSDDPTSPVAAAKQGMTAGLNVGAGGSGADLTYSVTGDTATGSSPSLPEPLKFRKISGKWLIDGTKPTGVDDQQMKMAAAMIPMMSKAIDKVIADVQAGKFKSIDEVGTALMAAMLPQGPGGGGG